MRKLLFLVSILLFLTTVSAFSPTSPAEVSLDCGDYTSLIILGVNSNASDIANTIFAHPPKTGVEVGFDFKHITDGGKTLKVYIFTDAQYCTPGTTHTEFNIGSENYRINIEVLKEEYSLGEKLISTNEALNIGQDISFGVLGIGDGSVHYILQGCQSVSEEDTMTDEISKTCSGNIDLRVKLLFTLPELGTGVAKFEVFSSEPSFILTKSNQSIDNGDSSECVLGIDTLGAKVKRGSVFAFNTINSNSGKYEDNVIINVLDQAGDLTPISGTSDNTGFFSKRIHEDYKQDLLIKLFKDGCEPTNKVILFEQSYDDYKLAKDSEQGALQLVLNVSGRFVMGTAISWTVTNALGEVVDGVDVKITKPDSVSLIVTTDASGVFSWTPDMIGLWKVQGGLDNYESTKLNEIEIFQDKTYLIVVKVNGEQKGEYKKNDRINFELRDVNNSLIPLTIDSTFAGLPLRFISGISDTITFEGTSALTIPAVEGYIEQTITLTEKTTNWTNILWGIGIAIGVIVILFLIGAVIKKKRGMGSGKPPQQMEIQMGRPGEK